MSKTNKAAAVLEMLNKGLSIKQIRDRMDVSPSYVHTLKKKMVHKEEEPKPGEFIEVEGQLSAPELNAILDARAQQYGSFMRSSDTAIKIKRVMHMTIAQGDAHLFPDQLQALDMIATKIARILTGNPSHIDSWVDIAGYAKLVADRLQGNVR
jgi:hypothetical protein